MDFTKLIAQGYSAMTILESIFKKQPSQLNKIKKLISYGYAAPTILKTLARDKNHSEEDYTTSEQRISKNSQNKRNESLKVIGGALGIAGGAGLLAGGGRAAGAVAGAIPQGGPGPTSPAQGASTANQGITPPIPPTVTSATSPPVNPQTQNPIQGLYRPTAGSAQSQFPTAQSPQQQELFNKLNKLPQNSPAPTIESKPLGNIRQSSVEQNYPHLANTAEKYIASGKTPEESYELLSKSRLMSPLVKKYEEAEGKSYLEALKGHQNKQNDKIASDVVITPFGAGDFHKKSGDSAYVEVGEKLRKVPSSEIEEPPEDVREAVHNILKIPEIDRSSNVALFLYDPTESKAIFQFHDGSAYKYLDMDPEIVRKIAEKEATPITEGKNMYGAWSPDDPHGSLGAALWAYILKNPKYAKPRKGEPANNNYMKLETLYDYYQKLRLQKKRKIKNE